MFRAEDADHHTKGTHPQRLYFVPHPNSQKKTGDGRFYGSPHSAFRIASNTRFALAIANGDDWRLLETARLPLVLAGSRLLDDEWRPIPLHGLG